MRLGGGSACCHGYCDLRAVTIPLLSTALESVYNLLKLILAFNGCVDVKHFKLIVTENRHDIRENKGCTDTAVSELTRQELELHNLAHNRVINFSLLHHLRVVP
jgi:hypothetical protein